MAIIAETFIIQKFLFHSAELSAEIKGAPYARLHLRKIKTASSEMIVEFFFY